MDALTDVLVAVCVWTTFSVVFTVGVVFATEVWTAGVTIAVVSEVTDADQFLGTCSDAVCIGAACTAAAGSLDALKRIAFVAFRANAVLAFPIA